MRTSTPLVCDLLLMVEDELPRAVTSREIDGWPDVDRELVADWAACVHLKASDNDVAVPPIPTILLPPEVSAPASPAVGKPYLDPVPVIQVTQWFPTWYRFVHWEGWFRDRGVRTFVRRSVEGRIALFRECDLETRRLVIG